MKTEKHKHLKISFPSTEFNSFDNNKNTPKLSINNSFNSLFKESNKNPELKLPSIKSFFSSNNSTNQNSNNESKQIALKKKKINDSFFKRINRNNSKITKVFGNRFKNFSVDIDKNSNNNHSLKMSDSTSSMFLKNFKKYKIKSEFNFHRNLMAINNEKINNSIMNSNKEKEDPYLKSIFEDPSKKPPKISIFGPRNNIINILREEMERLKYDNIYKDVKEDLKELIKDEIMDAQVRLKRQPENLMFNKKLDIPTYIKKMEKYKYISSINKIRELNQIGNIPVIEKDGNIMKRLANDAYDALIQNREKKV